MDEHKSKKEKEESERRYFNSIFVILFENLERYFRDWTRGDVSDKRFAFFLYGLIINAKKASGEKDFEIK